MRGYGHEWPDEDKTTTEPWGARELRLSRFRAKIADDRPTGVTCPACDGAGICYTESAAMYSAITCSLCMGDCWVPTAIAYQWRIRNLPTGAGRSSVDTEKRQEAK